MDKVITPSAQLQCFLVDLGRPTVYWNTWLLILTKMEEHISSKLSFSQFKKLLEAGEMAQKFRALAAPAEDQSSIPNTLMSTHNHP